MSGYLSPMQKRYIWLAGSFPGRMIVQGRGNRKGKLMYAVDERKLTLFGYGTPIFFLANRGLLRKIDEREGYELTPEGKAAFDKLLASQAGLKLNDEVERVTIISPRSGQ